MQEKISLYCQNGSSDKEYHLQLEAKGDGFIVNFQNGRRGGTLRSGTKTTSPLPYDKAKAEYDKVLKSKLKDGYTPSEGAQAFHNTEDEGRFTGIVPQLLNAIDEDRAQELLDDDEWALQEKYDGHRRALRNDSSEALSINRKGLVTGMPKEVAQAFAALSAFAPLTVDGELMGSSYALFDVRELKGQDTTVLPLDERLALLEQLKAALAAAGTPVTFFVAPTAFTAAQKREVYERLKRTKAEGAVFKRRDAQYVPGRPASGGSQLKRKFTHSATVLVTRVNTRRSVAVHALDEQGQDVPLGNVTIPANHAIPQVGALVEVRYLYAYPGGSLFQPQYLGVRDDLDRSDCTLSQLRYKQSEQDLDDDTGNGDQEAA